MLKTALRMELQSKIDSIPHITIMETHTKATERVKERAGGGGRALDAMMPVKLWNGWAFKSFNLSAVRNLLDPSLWWLLMLKRGFQLSWEQ